MIASIYIHRGLSSVIIYSSYEIVVLRDIEGIADYWVGGTRVTWLCVCNVCVCVCKLSPHNSVCVSRGVCVTWCVCHAMCVCVCVCVCVGKVKNVMNTVNDAKHTINPAT